MNAADTILRAWVNAYQRYKKIGQDGSLAALAAKAGLDAARNAAFAWADAQKAPQPRTAEPGQHTHADARLEAAQRTMDARFQSAAEPAPAPADEPPPLPTPAWWYCSTHGPAQPNAWGCPECVREMRAELQAARAASPVPAGWKLVPVEPTEAMLRAAENTPGMMAVDKIVVSHQLRSTHNRVTGWPGEGSPVVQAYKAMLAASPASPAQPPQGAQQE
jgi:hypothetical protein